VALQGTTGNIPGSTIGYGPVTGVASHKVFSRVLKGGQTRIAMGVYDGGTGLQPVFSMVGSEAEACASILPAPVVTFSAPCQRPRS